MRTVFPANCSSGKSLSATQSRLPGNEFASYKSTRSFQKLISFKKFANSTKSKFFCSVQISLNTFCRIFTIDDILQQIIDSQYIMIQPSNRTHEVPRPRIIAKVIHSGKNLFCNVGHICNLVQEFNGLVSKRVNQKIGPFYF